MNRRQVLIEDLSEKWKPERFGVPRLPLVVGKSPTEFTELPSALDMLVKLPGEDTYTVPAPWSDDPSLTEFLEISRRTELSLFPERHLGDYAYLTFDQRTVEPGKTQRNAGWHFDGMQGARYTEKLLPCHQYVASSTAPTLFSSHPVDATELDELRHNWFKELGRQVPNDAESFEASPGEICLMSAYQLHRSPVVSRPVRRTFVRLDYSQKQQDRLGNTPNPDLPAPWDYVERSLPEGLAEAVNDTGWAGGTRA